MWLSGPAATAPPTKVSQSTAAWMRSSPQMMPVPKAFAHHDLIDRNAQHGAKEDR